MILFGFSAVVGASEKDSLDPYHTEIQKVLGDNITTMC